MAAVAGGEPVDPHADRAASAQVDAGKHEAPPRRRGADQGVLPSPGAMQRDGTGLCLSGGGYRATLFHLGALRRLDELGILGTVRTVTGVSGGSLAATMLLHPQLRWPQDGAPGHRVGGFEELVAQPLRELAATNIRTPAVLWRLRPDRWFLGDGGTRGLAAAMRRAVPWWSTPLRDIGTRGPAVIVVATEVGYGLDWHFCDPTAVTPHGRVGDYRLGYAEPPSWLTLADCAATSCSVPPVFAPRILDGDVLGLEGGTPGPEPAEVRAAIRREIKLTDGGVYDNLGLEPVWKDHATVLVSDGGPVFRTRTTRSVIGRVIETIALAADSSTSVRLRWLHSLMEADDVHGATWALDTVVADHGPSVRSALARVRTDLDAFTAGERQVLERHGYLVADAMVREHAPESVVVDAPLAPPYDAVASDTAALAALDGSSRRKLLGRS